MKLAIDTVLDAPAAEVWTALQTTALLQHVSAPLITFAPKDPPAFPEIWPEGPHLVGIRLFGVLPIGDQWIVIEQEEADPGAGRWRLRDNGRSALIRRWDHRITLTDRGDGTSRYRDALDLDAGLLTPLVWLFAQVFYRHRQRRWRALVRAGLPKFETARAA